MNRRTRNLRRVAAAGTASLLALVACDPEEPGSIGDRVFVDADGNGIDDGEAGLADVTVELYDSAGNLVESTVTAGDGSYLFADVAKGDYEVEFVLPPDHAFTAQDQGGDDEVDSDADPTTGRTGTIKISHGSDKLQYDAGAVPVPAGPVAPSYSRTIGGPSHSQLYPSGMDVDESDNLYVADTGNDEIVKFDDAGNEVWRVGKRGTMAGGNFSNPRDVAYHDGKVYVADTDYTRAQVIDAATGSSVAVWPEKFSALMGITDGVDGSGNPVILLSDGISSKIHLYTPTGTKIGTVGSGYGPGPGQLKEPRDAATDASGNIYVADFKNHRVAVFDAAGNWVGSWGSQGSDPGQFKEPYGIELDDNGDVYVADSNNRRIQKFRTDGTYLTEYGTHGEGPGQFSQHRNLTVGNGTEPDVYGADLWGRKIVRFNQDGSLQQEYGDGPAAPGGFNEPFGVAVDSGDVFVADQVNHRAQRFDASGTFELEWGSRGWAGDLSGMNWPRDLTVMTATNTVWLADTKNSRILEYDRDGNPTGALVGSRGNAEGQFIWPMGVDAVGDELVVTDTYNHRVQRIDPDAPGNPVVWSATGFTYPKDLTVHGSSVFVADSVAKRIVELDLATGAELNVIDNPDVHRVEGIAVESDGDIWVSDTPWNRLVQLAPDGTTLQVFGSKGSAEDKFNSPAHLELDETGPLTELYVVDTYNDRVQVFEV